MEFALNVRPEPPITQPIKPVLLFVLNTNNISMDVVSALVDIIALMEYVPNALLVQHTILFLNPVLLHAVNTSST